MELNGMALAPTARMRERTLSSTAPLGTPDSLSTLSTQSAATEASVLATEEAKPAASPGEELDKYDISLIACTD